MNYQLCGFDLKRYEEAEKSEDVEATESSSDDSTEEE